MPSATLVSALYSILGSAALLIAVPLGVATLVGFGIGLLQAVTQLQEQTLPQTTKMAVVCLVLVLFGGLLTAPFFSASQTLFDSFYLYGK